VAVVLMVVTGALAVGSFGSGTNRTAMPGDGLAVRFVPAEVPPGLRLAAIASAPTGSPAPLPRVSVFEGDGVTVRIAVGSYGWAAGPPAAPSVGAPPTSLSASSTGAPETTTPPATGPPGTSSPLPPAPGDSAGTGGTGVTTTTVPPSSTTTGTTPTTEPAGRTTTVPATGSTGAGDAAGTGGPNGPIGSTDPTTTMGPTTPGDTPATTVAASLDRPRLPGLPDRGGIEALTVRGAAGGVEAHGDTSSTVWFEHASLLVAVDVFGLDADRALDLVERLTARPNGGFDPDPPDGLVSVAETGAGGGVTDPPAIAQLVYADGSTGQAALVVTTSPVAPGRRDLLTATAGSFGRIERWGDRDVLVDDGSVAFVDPAGVLVTVEGSASDLRSYVDSLEPIDQQAWDDLAADHPDLTVPPPTADPPTSD
jgi:hypothetical protein